MRELDCEIAVKIFGYHKTEMISGDGDFHIKDTKLTRWYLPDDHEIPIVAKVNNEPITDLFSNRLPHYSTNLNDAWLIVDWLIKEKNFHFHLDWIPSDNEWIAGGGLISGAKTPELAICKIALKVVNDDK